MPGIFAFLFVVAAMGVGATAQPHFVDLSDVASTSLESTGAEGWSGEGINDMFVYPPLPQGEFERNGYRFRLPEPKGNTVLMLRGRSLPKLPAEATVAVPEVKGRFVYFLQNSVRSVDGQPANYRVAVYTIHYSDNTKVEIPIHDGVEIRRWWTGQWYDNSGANSWPIFMGANAVSSRWKQYVGVWAMQWSNPHPVKAIRAIEFRSEGLASPAIFAITIADEDWYKSPDVKKDYGRPEQAPPDYFAPKLASEQPMVFAEMRKAGMVQGVRSVEVIRPDLLAVTIDAAVSEGAGLMNDKAAAFQVTDAFAVTSETDAAYQASQSPARVGRQSFEYWNGDIGPFQQNQIYWHTYYLHLDSPLKAGNEYTIQARKISDDLTSILTLAYDPATTVTPAIKVNQVAYSALAQRRYAYLGWWAGDSGTVDYATFDRFQVVDEKNGKIVLSGKLAMRNPDDKLSGEQVLEMDLSPLKAGRYHIVVPGLARSSTFDVGGESLRDLYFHTNRAFYHQRCGMELAPPFTEFTRPACHLLVYEGGHLVGSPRYAPKPREATKEMRGGYHDAADFDTFTYHLRATAQVLTAFEVNPAAFKDKDLNIPESGNGIPDVLDEAAWALTFYLEHQEADGGIPRGRGNDEDAIRDWERQHKGSRPPFGLFPSTPTSCLEYAAVAAQYGRIIQPFDKKRSAAFIESARRAFAWAHANAEATDPGRGRDLFMAWAAAELYSATGAEEYNNHFKRLHAEGATRRYHWSLTATMPTCVWSYITCKRPGVDQQIQKELREQLIKRAEGIVADTDRPAYRVGRGPAEKDNGWGNLNGGGHWADPCLRAYWLTRDAKFLTAASLNADFQLGANPTSRTFISGMGSRFPRHPQISAFLYTGPNKTGDTVKGITVYGLASNQTPWYPETPSWRRWRDIGNGGAEVSSEFTITETIGASAMLYSALYALELQPAGR